MKHKNLIVPKLIFLVGIFFLISKVSYSQNPACDAGVPYFLVDLTGSPDGVWSSANVSRNDQCCGAPNKESCISFDVILDTGAVGIQIDMVGADPAGSLYYSIDCLGSYPGGTVKCISGAGPHRITFCKPGNNKNIYTITSVSKPNFSDDEHVRKGCSKKIETLGIVDNSTIWQSVYPGSPGDFNSYLSCTNCASPIYTPALNAPPYVEYYVCGFPTASNCGYNITVCDTVRIYNDSILTTAIQPSPATFCNNGPGSGVDIHTKGSGGLMPYSYKWRNSSNVIVGTDTTYFASAAGNYTVEISDSLNSATCPSYFSMVTVSVGQLPIVSAGVDQIVCASSPSVYLAGSVQYASGGIWSGGSGVYSPGNSSLNTMYTPTSLEILSGSLTLTLTSTGAGGGCTNVNDQVVLYFSDTLKVSTSASSLSCNNSNTLINSSILGGISPYTYQWSQGGTTSSILVGEGSYSLIVTDSIGCTGSQTYNLTAPSSLSLSFSTIDVTTNGGNDGQATVNVLGGTSPYSYNWSPGGQTTSTITGLYFGIETVVVTDANGCSISGSTVINEPRCLGFNVTATSTNVSCNGGNNGTGSSIAVGGTLPYTYSWNSAPTQTTQNANNLIAGVYTITVSDNNLCLQTATIVVLEPSSITKIMNQTNPTSIGGSNGSATINAFGGTSPYSYLWNNGGTTSTISSLLAAKYYVTITDFNGCIGTDSVLLVEPPCNDISLSVITTNLSCFGDNSGSAEVLLLGATPPISISWSDGQSGSIASNLAEGNYSVSITDSNNCVLFKSFSITQPLQLSVGSSVNPITCSDFHDGTLDLSVSGGVFQYVFLWSNGSATEDLINLYPITYSVVVTDDNGCTAGLSKTFINPPLLSSSYLIKNPTCIYGTDGYIDLTLIGGVLPYTYNWSNGETTQDILSIQAGGYFVNVRDANGCTDSSPINISVLQPDSVQVASYLIDCSVPGSGKSLVTVVPSGGNPGDYQVSFDNGVTFQTAGDYDSLLINGGTYSVLVKDSTMCTSLAPLSIQVNPTLVMSAVNYSNCLAVGTDSTLVSFSVTGGDGGPYQISYDGGSTFKPKGLMSFNLAIGSSYNFVAKDTSTCISSTTSKTITSAFSTTASVTSDYNGKDVSCNGANDGSATTATSGGTAPYTYSWNTTPAQLTQNATALTAGTYTVTVTDNNGCVKTSSATLVNPTVLATTASVTSSYNGKDVSCNGENDGSATTATTGGTAPYTYSWNTIPVQLTQNATALTAGTYTVTVTDNNGCTTTSSATHFIS